MHVHVSEHGALLLNVVAEPSWWEGLEDRERGRNRQINRSKLEALGNEKLPSPSCEGKTTEPGTVEGLN